MSDNKSNYLVAFVLLVMLIVTATSILMEPKTRELKELHYTDLEMKIETDKQRYTVGNTIKANFTLINNSSETVLVQNFQRSLLHYMEHEDLPISLGHGVAGTIEIEGNSEYVARQTEFTVEKPGLLVLDFNGFNKTVGVIDRTDESLWSKPAEIIEKRPSEYKVPGMDFSSWFAVASKLGSLNRTGKLSYLPYVLVEYYPDWANGTAYIAMTDISPEYTSPILKEFSESIREDIRFIKASAPRVLVEKWQHNLWGKHDALEEAGVMVWESSYYFDGRLLVGVEDLDQEKADILCSIVSDVPSGILVLIDTEPILEF
ncbi:MAG: hypothetical protein E4G94_01685 [ANME-2 cluster archaeon]|nr:MAG: hypothetical protein E4G94_01685 [ANME-2 cluster archaeon]